MSWSSLKDRDQVVSNLIMISASSLSHSFGCPAAEGVASSDSSSFSLSEGTYFSHTNQVNLCFHCFFLTTEETVTVEASVSGLTTVFICMSSDPETLAPLKVQGTGSVSVGYVPTR